MIFPHTALSTANPQEGIYREGGTAVITSRVSKEPLKCNVTQTRICIGITPKQTRKQKAKEDISIPEGSVHDTVRTEATYPPGQMYTAVNQPTSGLLAT